MASLDRNIVVIALPTIATSLHTSLLTLVWIALGYWIVTASVLLNFGRLADIFGRVRLYNIGFALFTVGSALCSISSTGEQLIVFRIVQAFGAAFLFSNSAAILTDSFPENERGRALGLNQVSIVVGSVIGLTFGGFLTSYLGWRSVFWINIPIGGFATIWAYWKLHELGTIRREKIDWLGNATLATGLLLMLIGITFASFQIFTFVQNLFTIISGVVLIIIFYFVEKHAIKPMFDFSLFRINLFTGGNIAVFLNALARGAFTLVMAFYLQGSSMNLTPIEAGIYLIPVSVSLALFAPVTGWLFDRSKSGIFIPVGLVLSAIGFLILSRIGPTVTFSSSILPLALVGSGMGIFASPNRAMIMNSVPSHRRGVAAAISTTLVMMGSAFSIGMVFLIFTQVMPLNVVRTIFIGTSTTHSDLTRAMIVPEFMNALHLIFFISAILMLLSVIPSFVRPRLGNKLFSS
jgi:EmrB/QacA subfamily drug resistance transporter